MAATLKAIITGERLLLRKWCRSRKTAQSTAVREYARECGIKESRRNKSTPKRSLVLHCREGHRRRRRGSGSSRLTTVKTPRHRTFNQETKLKLFIAIRGWGEEIVNIVDPVLNVI
ncbi:hypothetical protein UY3_15107 [Chelonia mydas]|uniref:Uncharacterized protein n=1 Tax=Chelonia mydas TaxID=8469 RepID=M7AR68_CHEMY|nr:hypothetical protein UY3_15107 [Chelonia mydas]